MGAQGHGGRGSEEDKRVGRRTEETVTHVWKELGMSLSPQRLDLGPRPCQGLLHPHLAAAWPAGLPVGRGAR